MVDNASSDGSVGHIKSLYPSVEIIQAGANLGYAGGVNRGIRAALERDAHWVFLINNDATVRPTTIRGLVAAAQGRDRVAAVMPLIVFSHDPSLVWFAGASFDPRRSRPGRVEGYREPLPLRQPVSRQIDRITGAAVLLRAKALRDVGLFDEQLFFQYEDVDWSLRARQRGWEIHFDPSAVVEHKVAGSSGGERSRLSRYYATRNHLVIQDRHGPTTPGRSALREIATVAPGLLRCLLQVVAGWGPLRQRWLAGATTDEAVWASGWTYESRLAIRSARRRPVRSRDRGLSAEAAGGSQRSRRALE